MPTNQKLSEADLDSARTHARLAIIGEVSKLYERLAARGVINQSRLAERLGVSRQHISQLLSGPGSNNWTLNKVGELLAAMDGAITRIEMTPIDEISPSNQYHPWLDAKVAIESLKVKVVGSNDYDQLKPRTESKPAMSPPRLNIRDAMITPEVQVTSADKL